MKKTLIALLFIIIPFQVALFGSERQKKDIGSGWKFRSGVVGNEPSAVSYDDASWSAVTIPHTWNQTDAQDGGNNYLRTVGWYRKTISRSDEFSGKKLYLELSGANMQAECFVNGVSVGIHKGGYTAFRFDITEQMNRENNIIAIKVDNRHSEEIAPLSGDFSFFGGIYRKISLIVANPVHVDLTDNGASGLYLTTSDVSESSAGLEIRAKVVNTSNTPAEVTLNALLRYPDSFAETAEIPRPVFNVNEMKPGGSAIKNLTETVTIPANDSYEFKQKVILNNPHLWNGKKDPFRYLVDFTVSQNGAVTDSLSEYVGFRYFSVNKNGFFLNGKLYPLRGVNRHQDRDKMGNAITEKEHDEDFGLIYEVGANSIRLAHYPQDSYMYELCDRYGLVVWAEIPFVNNLGTASSFGDVTKSQLRELIRQQYNRPSICFWGLQNEVRAEFDTQMKTLITELNNLAHAEDPSRLTTQATNHGTANNWASDVIAWNTYPGWYGGGSLGGNMDSYQSASRPSGVSEYGAGANINQHEINPAQPSTTGNYHPEEYQNKVHENAIKDIAARNHVWCTFLWNMFDFASDYRDEGNRPGINDKGLVTYDRKIKKDSFFAYKVNWNPEPEIYISSRRFVERESDMTPVTVYSNCKTVELFVNDVSQGKKELTGVSCGFFKWDNVPLREGDNDIRAEGVNGEDTYTDQVVWKGVFSTPNHIAVKKPVSTDSFEAANPAANAVDGSSATRWAAQSSGAHWLEVDLEKEYILNQIKIQWYQPTSDRCYKYTITSGNNNKQYTTVVNRSNNTQGGTVTDMLNNMPGRYVRINVSGSVPSGYPSIHEIEIYGWTMQSRYAVDFSKRTIGIPDTIEPGTNLSPEDFLDNISFYGNEEHEMECVSYFVQPGDKLIITDVTGNKTVFTVRFEENTGIKDIQKGLEIIYLKKNPELISVKLIDSVLSAMLDIFDISGKKLFSGKIENELSFHLTGGMYVFKAYNESLGVQVIKYIV